MAYKPPNMHETAEQKRNRLKKNRLIRERQLANRTLEHCERLLEKNKKRKQAKQAIDNDPEIQEEKEKNLKKVRQRLRKRSMLRYNCETLEQFGERIKRNRNRVPCLPKYLERTLAAKPKKIRKEDKPKKKKKPKKPKVMVKKDPDEKVEEEDDEELEMEFEETPEEFMERKRYDFMCMEMEMEINKVKRDLKKERSKTLNLAEQLDKLHTRAKELTNYYGIPICNGKMYRYHVSDIFIE